MTRLAPDTKDLVAPAARRPPVPPGLQALAPPAPSTEAESLLVELAEALHRAGTPAHRLEPAVQEVGSRMGVNVSVFAAPTLLILSVRDQGGGRAWMRRLEPGDVNLQRLSDLDRVLQDLLRGATGPSSARRHLQWVLARQDRPPPAADVAAFGLASAAAAVFFGGGLAEVGAAGLAGLLTGLVAVATAGSVAGSRLLPFLASAAAAALIHLLSAVAPLAVNTAVVASLIVIVPGFTLTVALTELATRHLLSGTARLAGALETFLLMAFGVGVADAIMARLLGPVATAGAEPLPMWAPLVALGALAVAFTVLLRGRAQDVGWTGLGVAVAWLGAELGARLVGAPLGVGLGAFLVSAGAGAWSRWQDRPVSIPLVPGMLLLVPGALGFRSMDALLDEATLDGIQVAFAALLGGTSLVAGSLLGSTVIPPRRSI